jgi:hypothetical protein
MSDLENKLRALMRSDRAVLKRRQDAQDLKDAEVDDREYSEHERKLRRERDARRLGVDLVDRQLGTNHLVLRESCVDTGYRINHAHFQRRFPKRLDDERCCDLRARKCGYAMDYRATIHAARIALHGHVMFPENPDRC